MVVQLFLAYGPLKDASTHLPLFNQQNWKTAKQILELIQQGYISDPPGITLYSVIAIDAKADNPSIYRCSYPHTLMITYLMCLSLTCKCMSV